MLNLNFKKYLIIIVTYVFLFSNTLNSETLRKIIIKGNERVSNETIKIFTSIQVGDEINTDKLNQVISNLYDTNFFENISVNFVSQELIINVQESPIINEVIFNGIKSKTLKETITKNILLKSRSSFNEFQLDKDRLGIIKELKNQGYYYSKIEILKEIKENN